MRQCDQMTSFDVSERLSKDLCLCQFELKGDEALKIVKSLSNHLVREKLTYLAEQAKKLTRLAEQAKKLSHG